MVLNHPSLYLSVCLILEYLGSGIEYDVLALLNASYTLSGSKPCLEDLEIH